MIASSKERLSARVRAANKAGVLANQYGPLLAAALRPFVGKKVFNQGFVLSKAVENALPKLPYGFPIWITRSGSGYSLCWTVRVHEQIGENDSVSFELGIYVGECSGHDLKALYPEDRYMHFRSDYTAEEILKLRAAYQLADKARDEARSALHPFGEYDR